MKLEFGARWAILKIASAGADELEAAQLKFWIDVQVLRFGGGVYVQSKAIVMLGGHGMFG